MNFIKLKLRRVKKTKNFVLKTLGSVKNSTTPFKHTFFYNQPLNFSPTSNNRQSLPLKVVQHLAANSYDTLVALSAKMADKSGVDPTPEPDAQKFLHDPPFVYKDSRMAKISKNLGDIVAERRMKLLQQSGDSGVQVSNLIDKGLRKNLLWNYISQIV